MAGRGGARGGGDRVLESRHLIGLFLGVVMLCGVFFTLGYVMGRTQYGLPVSANSSRDILDPPATTKPKPPEKKQAANPGAVDTKWDFYPSDKNPNQLESSATTSSKTRSGATSNNGKSGNLSATAADAREWKRFTPPQIKRGAPVLQLAAMTKEADALSLADELQRKSFPAFVVTPTTDPLYRVQVGPYPDVPAAEKARDALDHAGFKAIVKR